MFFISIDKNRDLKFGNWDSTNISEINFDSDDIITINYHLSTQTVDGVTEIVTNSRLAFKSQVDYTQTVKVGATFMGSNGCLLEAYLTDDNVIKFKLLNPDNRGYRLTTIYPTNSDEKIDNNATLLASIKLSYTNVLALTQGMPLLYIKTPNGITEYYLKTAAIADRYSCESRDVVNNDIKASWSNYYIKSQISTNTIDTETDNIIKDLVDTTSDLSSESAAKFVSR